MSGRKIIVLSPYDAASHRYWHSGLSTYCDKFEWQVLTMPARHFSWRIRGNPLAFVYHEWFEKTDFSDCDLVIATSMTDVATLRGLLPSARNIPFIVYFHENQFAYPSRNTSDLDARMVQLYSALSAEKVLFNSTYNQNSFVEGCRLLFKQLPDFAPQTAIQAIELKSTVLPVPLRAIGDSYRISDEASSASEARNRRELQIVWNHRWEYDKGPDRLLRLIKALYKITKQFRIHIVGQQFRRQPHEFSEIKNNYPEILGHFGFIEARGDYLRLLADCDVALSTAIHDFQGIALLEAVQFGCIPLAPNRLVYPAHFDRQFLYRSNDDLEEEAASGAQYLAKFADQKSNGELPKPPSVTHLTWPVLVAEYDQTINQVLASGVAR